MKLLNLIAFLFILSGCATNLTPDERMALIYGAQMMNQNSMYYFGQAQENARANAWNNTFSYTMRRY